MNESLTLGYSLLACLKLVFGASPGIRWLDTSQSWSWLLDNWARVYQAAGVTASERLYFAFSFGPHLGFWTAFESAIRLGCLCISGGGANSIARLHWADSVLLCCVIARGTESDWKMQCSVYVVALIMP